MRQLLIACVALAAALPAAAQTTKEEMLASPEKTAGVYYAYPAPESTDHYTKAPKGYTPFYISHFGRHGSRYLISDSEYTNPMETLERADKAGARWAKTHSNDCTKSMQRQPDATKTSHRSACANTAVWQNVCSPHSLRFSRATVLSKPDHP